MKSLKGHLLIAAPSLLDPNFVRTVLLMLEHNEEGAAGIILNRPTDAEVTQIISQVFPDQEEFEWDKAIHLGGPVPGPLMVIHTMADLADQEILDGVYSCIDATKVQEIIRRRAEPSLIVANYAGWGPGQLEAEMEQDSWLTLPASVEHIFWSEAGDLWDGIVKQIHSARLAQLLGIRHFPADPSVN
ncbi:MAG: YqgE/AlgH family protein [Isosphaeraceae bacterium]|nr:YqgE/AlgH family protein [Isosphaeraceae bacterium]